MYAKIENDEVVQWPISNIQQLFPNTSFPSPITDADLPDGYVKVGVIAPPVTSDNQSAVPGAPIKDGNNWVQSWDILAMDANEIAQRDAAMAIEIRMERNRLLAESDWTQLADASGDKSAWAAYRQALRDITQQPGFPLGTAWPSKP
jgi:hypothetical protein